MNNSTKSLQRPRARQGGSFLLEGMIAILVFAFGILGLVGMLAGSLRASNDARYRTEAINLANAIVGDMWTTQAADLDTQFGSGGTKLTAWQAHAASLLPSATGANAPQIDLTQAGLSAGSRSVVVTVFWQLPGAAERHQILLTAQIGKNT